MRAFSGIMPKVYWIMRRRALALVVRAAVLMSMSFAGAFGFISGINAQSGNYDPHAFAIGIAALLGAACGAIGLLVGRTRLMRVELRELEGRVEEMSDRNWELKEAEERARSFLESQCDLIVRRDGQGFITYVNDAFCALAGKSRRALLGTTFELPVLEQGDAALLPDGTRLHDQKIDGAQSARWIAWREVTVRADGENGPEIQGVGRDITDRAVTERVLADARDQAHEANRAKSRFLAMVSHEIRTPLNGILGMADLLSETPLTPEQATYTKAVKTSGDTLLALIEEILDFSKIEAGKLDIEPTPFALAAFVEETVELISTRAQVKALEIACYVDERLPDRVVGDAARLRQILYNLVGNAIKFTEQGGVSMIVEPGQSADEIAFTVRDTGIGVSPEDLDRIFRDFEQADSGSGRRFGGTGLGLAISKRIVERMDGRIEVDSVPGVGSTFRVSLPLARAADAAEATLAVPDLAGSEVLIAAPAAIEAALIARRLQRWGARTSVVPDETVAAALLSAQTWDAILVDHALGRVAADACLKSAVRVPRRIVLLTPSVRDELGALKAAGFTGYLIKPVRAASLAARFAVDDDGFERAGSTDAIAVHAETRAEHVPGASAGLAILVAEDNEINALLARALLTKLGHRPTIAPGGAAAYESWHAARAAGARYDLVLMDVHMPGIDGLEASRRIRAAEAALEGPRTPIIALTANAFAEDREACLNAGMDGFLVKPLDRERLQSALAAVRAPAPLAA